MTFLLNYKPIRISQPAQDDLKSIADYTKNYWGDVQKNTYLALIKKSLNVLSASGNIGQKRDEIAIGLFSYQLKKHVIFFRENSDEYVVLRVLHSQMDIHKQLK